MQPVTWDMPGLTWDNPNLRWGDPSYLLEPGDPEYTPPPGTTTPTLKPKRNRMAKSDYLPANDDEFSARLQMFKTGIGTYAATVGVTPAQVTAQAADADYFKYVLASQQILRGASQQWTNWKNLAREGGTEPLSGAAAPPVLPASVPAVAPGIEGRFRALVKQIKANPNYNTSIGEALGIEGTEQTGPELTTVQPEIGAIVSGNAVQLTWNWGSYSAFLDQCEIHVDRGSGWTLLTIDTTPNYTDTTPLPATPTKWKYRAIYRVADAQVGLWSATVEIMVGG